MACGSSGTALSRILKWFGMAQWVPEATCLTNCAHTTIAANRDGVNRVENLVEAGGRA